MTREEELERNKRWTMNALSNTDGQGRPIVTKETTQAIPVLPRDKYGQVIIDDYVDPTLTKAYTGKPVFKQSTIKSIFADQPVVNVMSDF